MLYYIIWSVKFLSLIKIPGTKTETREGAARACSEATAGWKGETAGRAEAATGTSTQAAANDDRQK